MVSNDLPFVVGVSQTSKKDNSVTWASIPHETSLMGGPEQYGFPDPNYIVQCNTALDELKVPKAACL
jgi:Deltex C-terminal domain